MQTPSTNYVIKKYTEIYSVSYNKPKWKRIWESTFFLYNWNSFLYSKNSTLWCYKIVYQPYFNKKYIVNFSVRYLLSAITF